MRAKRGVAVLAIALAGLLPACTSSPAPPAPTVPPTTTTAPPEEQAAQIAIGVDSIDGGYNPHTLADSSRVTSALSSLLLPSVFRQSREGQSGAPALDETVMVSAEVTSTDPFTVAYVIRPDASWSDGAPIAAEDFIYLAEKMKTETGVVDPAGYRLISDIQSREGGKRVEVSFAKPYPGWRTLFDNLLPAHLLKDAPGGWQAALDDSFPAFGGPFAIKILDKARGEIILQRNERYWDTPAAIDQLVFRRADQTSLVQALRSGTIQFALAGMDATGVKLLDQLGDTVSLHTLARPRIASVLLRPVTEQLADDQVRSAIATLIDRDALIEVGTAGGSAAQLRADAQIVPPSSPAYTPTLPQGGPIANVDVGKAAQLLTDAGYTQREGKWMRDGEPLTLVIATPGTTEPFARIAEALAGQLVAAGIDVRTIQPAPRDLYYRQLAQPVIPGSGPVPPEGQETGDEGAEGAAPVGADIVVAPQQAGGDAATVLASRFGCRADQDKLRPDEPRVPANAAAFCDESMRDTIEKALTGTMPVDKALAELEPQLWQAHVSIPLFQLADTLAIGSGISGIEPGPPLAGPFGAATTWTRQPN